LRSACTASAVPLPAAKPLKWLALFTALIATSFSPRSTISSKTNNCFSFPFALSARRGKFLFFYT
jgi:hypothetical protein